MIGFSLSNWIPRLLMTAAIVVSASSSAFAEIVNTSVRDRLKQDTDIKVRSVLTPQLDRYCLDACQIIEIKVDMDEELGDTDDLGFEGMTPESQKATYFVKYVGVTLQVDDRVTSANRDRLQTILQNQLRSIGVTTEIFWRPVRIPSIGKTNENEEYLKGILESRLTKAVEETFSVYCPQECLLAQIDIAGDVVSLDEAKDYPRSQLVFDKAGQAVLRLNSVGVDIAINEVLDEESRQRIINVLRAKTRFASPLTINTSVVPFPESYASKKDRESKDSEDPYGLEKLRQMLTIFKELAGTKEIITSSQSKESALETSESKSTNTNSTSNSNSTESQTTSSLATSASELKSDTLTSSSRDRSIDTNSSMMNGEMTNMDLALLIGAGLLIVGLIIAVVMRVIGANRDAKVLMEATTPRGQANGAGYSGQENRNSTTTNKIVFEDGQVTSNLAQRADRMKANVRLEDLRNELINVFLQTPKVARETFGRMLKEEGVEETAKYVHILGQMVVFELLDDPNLQRDLYALSEFYHTTSFDFPADEEHKLLQTLKTKVTASEIRILSRRALDKFDFLAKLDAEQIYGLICDENSKVQSIVLSQLDKKRRMNVFNMYKGAAKVNLMGELSRADAIPKEYLQNVARALQKKVQSRPEFDAENLRSSDILLDLLERATLDEQRRLMNNLMKANPDTARGLKMKLVTIEMLPFLKDGHLLELVLGMEREDLLTFLMGARDHVRDLLLAKAPHELSESWMEDMRFMASVDEGNYRIVEMKIIGRLRQLAANGAISILDLNDMIFAEQNFAESSDTDMTGGVLSRGSLAA